MLFRRKKATANADDHAVLTHLPLSDDEFGTAEEREAVRDLEQRIEKAVAEIGGEHDGNEFGGGEVMLYTYGPDADQIFDAIQKCLTAFDALPGAYAIKRYGRADDPGAREEGVALT